MTTAAALGLVRASLPFGLKHSHEHEHRRMREHEHRRMREHRRKRRRTRIQCDDVVGWKYAACVSPQSLAAASRLALPVAYVGISRRMRGRFAGLLDTFDTLRGVEIPLRSARFRPGATDYEPLRGVVRATLRVSLDREREDRRNVNAGIGEREHRDRRT